MSDNALVRVVEDLAAPLLHDREVEHAVTVATKAKGLVITDVAGQRSALESLAVIAAAQKKLDAQAGPLRTRLEDAKRHLARILAPFTTPLEDGKASLRAALEQWQARQQREERERREREARAEAERRQQAADEENARRREQAAAAAAEDDAPAVEVEEVAPEPVVVEEVRPVVLEAAGVRVVSRKKIVAVVEDQALVPEQFKKVDLAALVRHHKATNQAVPGIQFVEEESSAIYS